LKNWQSGHQASGLKLVPAIGSTSRWPQHSGPSSGGRRQRQDLNFTVASDTSAVCGAAAVDGVDGVVDSLDGADPGIGDIGENGVVTESDIASSF
jgi:hypothetical protein